MNKDDQITAIELELHGLDVELYQKRMLHRSLVATIDYLEREQLRLIHQLQSLKHPYL